VTPKTLLQALPLAQESFLKAVIILNVYSLELSSVRCQLNKRYKLSITEEYLPELNQLTRENLSRYSKNKDRLLL
jgi:hypothetical protein